jgi:outer membrane lipase/esterase
LLPQRSEPCQASEWQVGVGVYMKTGLLGAAALALLAMMPNAVRASTFDNAFVFGDSTVDTGWFRYTPLPVNPTLNALAAASLADGGRIPDTPFGIGAAQVLAASFGLNANPADNGAGGTNFAVSGAHESSVIVSNDER